MNSFAAARGLSTAFTSHAIDTGSTFPNVTLPHFDRRAEEARQLAGSDVFLFVPYVRTADQPGWEDYALAVQPTVLANHIFASSEHGAEEEGTEEDSTNKEHEDDEDDEDEDDEEEDSTNEEDEDEEDEEADDDDGDLDGFLPIWQANPIIPSAIMMDLGSVPWSKYLALDVFEIDFVLISGVVNIDFLSRNEFDVDPHSVLLEPVFDSFDEIERNIAGFIFAGIAWKTYLNDLLTKGVNGLVVHVQETCGHEFTYLIKGNHATFLGNGDYHDTKYDYLAQTAPFAEFATIDGDEDDFGDDNCAYTMTVYPSDELREYYISHRPYVYTAVVMTVFFFTMLVFVLFDFTVRRRQEKVMATANRTNALVSSLFPATVRDRLLDEAHAQAGHDNKKKGTASIFGNKNRIKKFLNETAHSALPFDSKPIADSFPAVTVLVRVLMTSAGCSILCSCLMICNRCCCCCCCCCFSLRILLVSYPKSSCDYFTRDCSFLPPIF